MWPAFGGLQHPEPVSLRLISLWLKDFVLATGETHTVRDFCELAFKELGIELDWIGKDETEHGIVKSFNKEKLLSIISNLMKRNDKSLEQEQSQSIITAACPT